MNGPGLRRLIRLKLHCNNWTFCDLLKYFCSFLFMNYFLSIHKIYIEVLFSRWLFWFISKNQSGITGQKEKKILSSVNRHLTNTRFCGFNEAPSCADACEKGPPLKLLSFIAVPNNATGCPSSPEITLANPISFTTCHLLI